MNWIKKGLVYSPKGEPDWRNNSALQPNPILLNDEIIRIYAGFRDKQGVSRIGFVDVLADNPSKVIRVSKVPALDIGSDGSFDEFGVVPSIVLHRDNKIFMYYAGYQLGRKVRFLVLGGLAIADEQGTEFHRLSNVPIFERTNDEFLFRVPHSVIFENNKWKFWYGGGNYFIKGDSKTLPVYDVRYLESDDGINIPSSGKIVLKLANDEYRIGRPFVFKDRNIFKMYYGYSTKSVQYKLGYAESHNGISWLRKNSETGIDVSDSGWDSEMVAYPSIIRVKSGTYLFYNGNNYGYDGFGYAVLEDETN